MNQTNPEPASTTSAATATATASRHAALLFWIVTGIPVAMLIVAFPAINSSLFKRYGDPVTVSIQMGLFETVNRTCDILMYGDSTAEAGLDPAIVSNLTHMTACNIATGGPTLQVLGMDPFDRYLERNPKPKYLIMQFAAGNLHRIAPNVTDLDHFDGVIESIRFYGWLKTLPIMLRYPDYFIGLLNYTYKSGTMELVSEFRHTRAHMHSAQADSYLIFPRPPLTSCPIYNGGTVLPDPGWIAYLRQHYAGNAEHVLVNVSPTSPCNSLYAAWKSAIGDSTDNELELYPNNLFVDGTYHTSREGAIRRSTEVAQQILAAEARFHGPAPQPNGQP